MIRYFKVSLAAFVALFCLIYALQNLVNLQPAYGFVALMVGMRGHVAYPEHVGPSVHSPIIIWMMLWTIITLELIAGLLAVKGTFDLWTARNKSADDFNNAKKFAILGCGIGVIIWFGIFSAVGGAYFQMWQTEAGKGALDGAFQYAVLMGGVLLLINATDK